MADPSTFILSIISYIKSKSIASITFLTVSVIILTTLIIKNIESVSHLLWAIWLFSLFFIIYEKSELIDKSLKLKFKIKTLKKDPRAIKVILGIKKFENHYSDDSETLGLPIQLSINDIASSLDIDAGTTRHYIDKFAEVEFLSTGSCGELYGISSKGLAFLIKNNLIN